MTTLGIAVMAPLSAASRRETGEHRIGAAGVGLDAATGRAATTDEAEEVARREAAEDARRWLDRAESCTRAGMYHRHCLACADEALERAGLK